MIDQFAKHVKQRIDEQKQRINEAMISGSVDDIAAYKHLTGTHKGLLAAEIIIDDVLNNYKENTNDR